MIFDFEPWQLDIDIDLTKQLYTQFAFLATHSDTNIS